MKSKTIAALSLALVSCVLGGCANRTEQATVIVVDSGGASADSLTSAVGSSEKVGSSQAVGFSVPKSSSLPNLSQTPVSVVIPSPDNFDQNSDDPESSIPENVSSSSSSTEEYVVLSPPSSSSEKSSSSSSSSSLSSLSSLSSSSNTSSSSASSSEQPSAMIVPRETIVTNSYQTLNYSEVKGVWISFIELAGLQSNSESEFGKSLGEVYDNCVSLGINTVYVHVRSHGDAYYNSAYFPRTKYIGGSYDPLTVMIEEAHKRGLSFQAWINPMRGCAVSDIERENGYPMYEWAGGETRLVEQGGYYCLNPAYDEVIDLITKGAEEIVANYEVDGLHIDDYFYPTTEDRFDSAAFAQSSYTSLSDFRFANCDKLVSSLYSAVKRANPTALFGVSPQGNFDNNYAFMYADVRKWCTESGYLDYIMPQIYFGFKNVGQPFSEVIKQWDNIAATGKVPLIVGISPAKLGTEDTWGGSEGEFEWINDKEILKRQFLEATEQLSYGGICLYSYNSLFNADSDIKPQVDAEVEALKAAMSQ